MASKRKRGQLTDDPDDDDPLEASQTVATRPTVTGSTARSNPVAVPPLSQKAQKALDASRALRQGRLTDDPDEDDPLVASQTVATRPTATGDHGSSISSRHATNRSRYPCVARCSA